MKRTKPKAKSKAKRKSAPTKPYAVEVRIRVELDHVIDVEARSHEDARRMALKLAQDLIYENHLLDGEMWDYGFEVQNIERRDLDRVW